jgi:hypothetical protein
MEDKTVDELVSALNDSFKSSPDTACRNLVELAFQALELRDLAKDAFTDNFWEMDKENHIKLDDMKNLRMGDILFFKDAGFKKVTLKFFEKAGSVCMPETYQDKLAVEQFLEYVIFLTNSKLREFRNGATQMVAAFFTGMLKALHGSVSDHMKDSKPKVKLSLNMALSLLSEQYFTGFVRKRCEDVDTHIVAAVLEHLMSSYQEGLALAVDQAAFLATAQKADITVTNLAICKEGPLTKLTLGLLLQGLRSSAIERVARFLTAVPKIIEEIAHSQGGLAKWEVRSKEIAERNAALLHDSVPVMLKTMVEEKDEVGAMIIRFFLKAKAEQSCRQIVTSADEKIIIFMLSNIKPKTREAALDYAEKLVKADDASQNTPDYRKRANTFAKILYINQKYRQEKVAGTVTSHYVFDEERTLELLFPFIPSLASWFDARTLADLFLEEARDQNDEEIEQNKKAFIGCILLTVLESVRLIENDLLPASKISEDLRGDSLEHIKAECLGAKTLVKESVRKNIVLRYEDDPASFRVHLRLIMASYPAFDSHLQSTLLDIFARVSDPQLLREVAVALGKVVKHHERHSAIAGGVSVDEVQKLFNDLADTLAKLLAKWKRALQEEEPRVKAIALTKLEDDMVPILVKMSALKMSLAFQIKMDAQAIDSVGFLLDVAITDNLHNKKIVLHSLRVVHEHLKYLLKATRTNPSLLEDFNKWKDTCLEYLVYFMDRRSNQKMSTSDALEVRRMAFPLLTDTLHIVSHDKLGAAPSTYRRPDDQIYKIIWHFIEDYVFTTNPAFVEDPADPRSPTHNENHGSLDVERSPIQDSGTKDDDRIQAGTVYLRRKGFSFVEDVAPVITMVFKISLYSFRTIGLNLAQSMVLKILNLNSNYQGVFLSKIDEFFQALIMQEQETGNTQRLVFWKFVHSCLDCFDFATLKKLAKAVFRFYSRHHGSDEAKKRYENFCIYSVQWAADQKHAESVDRVLPFVKKSLFEDQRFVRLLYFAQNLLDGLKDEYKGRDQELLEADKFRTVSRLRDELAKMCQMKAKDDENKPASRRQSRSARRPSASKRKSAPVYMDDEKENVPQQDAAAAASKPGKKIAIKGIKGKKTKGAIPVEPEQEDQSKTKSSQSKKRNTSQRASRSQSRQSASSRRSASSSKDSKKNKQASKSVKNKKGNLKKTGGQKQKRRPSPEQVLEEPVPKKAGKGKKK